MLVSTAPLLRTPKPNCRLRLARLNTALLRPVSEDSALQHGLNQCRTVILGPGEAGQAHQTDERCGTDVIATAKQVYAALIGKWCA